MSAKFVPRSIKCSFCSSTNMWLKNCCGFSLAKLMQSCLNCIASFHAHSAEINSERGRKARRCAWEKERNERFQDTVPSASLGIFRDAVESSMMKPSFEYRLVRQLIARFWFRAIWYSSEAIPNHGAKKCREETLTRRKYNVKFVNEMSDTVKLKIQTRKPRQRRIRTARIWTDWF